MGLLSRFGLIASAFVCVGLVYFGLLASLAGRGRTTAEIVAAVVTFSAAMTGVFVLQRRFGRLSRAAFALVQATCVPLVLGGIAIADTMVGDQRFWVTFLVAVVPVIVLLPLFEHLIYSASERAALRSGLLAIGDKESTR